MFQDGKVVFVRHGGTFVRVSPNRLIRAGPGLDLDSDTQSMETQETLNKVTESLGDSSTDHVIDHAAHVLPHPTNQKDIKTVSLNKDDKIRLKLDESDEWKSAVVVSRAGKATGRYKNWYNIHLQATGQDFSVDLGEVSWQSVVDEPVREIESESTEYVNAVMVPQNQHSNQECVTAKQNELQKLKDFSTYKIVDDEGQPVISTRWVVSQKGDKVKARLVARGFEEHFVDQADSPTIGKSAVRLFLTIVASKDWTVKTTDIKSAFLQGMTLDRDVFITPPKEAGLSENKIWKLNRCLYGLNDGARKFYLSVQEHLLSKCGCEQSSLDPALFYYKIHGSLKGIICCHVDDFLHAGDEQFDREVMVGLTTRFVAGRIESSNFYYVGFELKQIHGTITLNQNNYLLDLEPGTMSITRASQKNDKLNAKEQTSLRQLVGKLNWVVHGTRPDMAFEMIDLSTKLKSGVVNDLLRAMKVIRNLRKTESYIHFPGLNEDVNHWRFVLFTDAAHANICQGTGSISAYTVFLTDGTLCCPLDWQANKIKRVVRSTLAAETLGLQEGFEATFYLQNLLKEIFGILVPIHAYVDNKSVIDAIHSTKLVDDKRLRIDIAALKESLCATEMTVKWCPGDKQLSNCMTKRGASSYSLLSVLQSGNFSI
jgi:hypothetical protein